MKPHVALMYHMCTLDIMYPGRHLYLQMRKLVHQVA